jgi:hypothetical protein
MSIGFDVTARAEEQTRFHVVDEQEIEADAIEKDGIRHEVPIQCGRLGSPKDVVGGFKPAQYVGEVLRLRRI